jgi:hypothetical protein
LNDKTGVGRTTATVSRPTIGFDETMPTGSEPEPPQALNKKVEPSKIADRVKEKRLHDIQVTPFMKLVFYLN